VLFERTPIAGVFVVVPERFEDERGFFARTYCDDEFAAHGLETHFVQCNVSWNHRSGTLRGMHYQAWPQGEAKLVRATAGAILDVAVDLRRGSATHLKHFAVELTAEDRKALYIPRGMAHGFLTLTDNAEVFYQMSDKYAPEFARGLRWDDPALAIDWPFEPLIINERDASYADYTAAADYGLM
jgi:dTDP-4-dehydrorhamnose 3,5-epimerase